MHKFLVHPRQSPLAASAAPVRAPETKGREGMRRVRRRRRIVPALGVAPDVACRIVRQLVCELLAMASDRPLQRRDSRRSTCHVRQIAMYVSHVVLRLPLSQIGAAFGRDRTTVGHACNVVEDRRDDTAFDAFVSTVERVVLSVFGPAGIGSHE